MRNLVIKIKVCETVATSEWLTDVIEDYVRCLYEEQEAGGYCIDVSAKVVSCECVNGIDVKTDYEFYTEDSEARSSEIEDWLDDITVEVAEIVNFACKQEDVH